MKKTLLTAALLTAFGVAVVAPQAANAASSSTINFTGKVYADTCVITVNGGAAVALPTVATQAASIDEFDEARPLPEPRQARAVVPFHIDARESPPPAIVNANRLVTDAAWWPPECFRATLNGTSQRVVESSGFVRLRHCPHAGAVGHRPFGDDFRERADSARGGLI
jgi:hypothetical protein